METLGPLIAIIILSILSGYWSWTQRKDNREFTARTAAKDTVDMLLAQIETLRNRVSILEEEVSKYKKERDRLRQENIDLMKRLIANGRYDP